MAKIVHTERTFRWSQLSAALLTAVVGFLLLAIGEIKPIPFAISVGVFLCAAGAVTIAGYFFRQPVNEAELVCGFAHISVGVWAAASYADLSRYVLGLAIGILLLLRAVSEIVRVRAMRGDRLAALRAVMAAVYIAWAVVLVVNGFAPLFARVYPFIAATGALLVGVCAEELVYLFRRGFWHEISAVYRTERPSVQEEDADASGRED